MGCTHLELYLRAKLQVNVKSGTDNTNKSGNTLWPIGVCFSFHKGLGWSSINDSIPQDKCSVQYASIQDAIELIKVVGRKSDISSAFRIINIKESQYKLFGFMWDGKYYYDKNLQMGCSSNWQIFENFSTAIEWIAKNKIMIPNILHILDDFMIVDKTEDGCKKELERFLAICNDMGIPISKEKTFQPSQVMSFVGYEIDNSGDVVCRQLFQHALNGALNFCGLSRAYYKPHSFRIGFATDASAKGLSNETIRILGVLVDFDGLNGCFASCVADVDNTVCVAIVDEDADVDSCDDTGVEDDDDIGVEDDDDTGVEDDDDTGVEDGDETGVEDDDDTGVEDDDDTGVEDDDDTGVENDDDTGVVCFSIKTTCKIH
ncbi:unnamed protein product [Mytilus coruscus]|uniref:Reverse transcriptase domain-containing protein n=1 Tax=Mytilus coruscus TaxID=42192 RepID=A0A6J7ZWG4_MYTCO|nr:unnamed protein product [Mytilus coruscus]